MTPQALFSPRKIGVCGSSKELSREGAAFCNALGRRLAAAERIKIVSGGTKKRLGTAKDDFAADWLIISAAQKAMNPGLVPERIVTVVRDDASGTMGFTAGAETRARGRTSEARRISFVRDLDGLIAVGGRGGTNQELALAIEHDVHLLPVPTFGGAAREYWKAYRSDLIMALRITERIAQQWERRAPTEQVKLRRLADGMVKAFLRSLPRRCFVIMPFHEDFEGLYDFVIEPAIRAAGDDPIRLDRLRTPGDVKKQIDDGIRHCEYVIAVLDHWRHNVLYEVGFAHGQGKPTFLMNRKGTLDGDVPFDLSTQQRLEYTTVDAALLKRVHMMIAPPLRSRRRRTGPR
jgi:predicted Rossmann-fold nucleotide-binding protein